MKRWEMWLSSERQTSDDGTRYVVDADRGDEDRSAAPEEIAALIMAPIQKARTWTP